MTTRFGHKIEKKIDLTLFIACYNEELLIIDTLLTVIKAAEASNLSWEIIIIDDASTDESVKRIVDFIRSRPDLPIELYVNEKNMGVGHNYVEAAFRGRGKYFRMVCGDNVEPYDTLVLLFSHIGSSDLIIPYHSRPIKRNFIRTILSNLYVILLNKLSGLNIRYYNGLPIVNRYNILRRPPKSKGFGFQGELIISLIKSGLSYIEVPVISTERAAGRSKALKIKNILSVFFTIFRLIICIAFRLFSRNPTLNYYSSYYGIWHKTVYMFERLDFRGDN